MRSNQVGFTLIELLIVIAIISVLATMALPSFQDRIIRTQVQEGIKLSEFVRQSISEYYREHQAMPKDNAAVSLPQADKILGNYVEKVSVRNGVIDIVLGARINVNAKDKILSIRPAIVKNEPQVPIAWIYGYASVPKGMDVSGDNRSDILSRFLPVNCRY
ncbi:MAG: hypothetical protein DRP47_10680 [Candidatus Zixiibacteriota bacterium]|nr:MAG: hypothetical protein DRP47_10680 [candidate division Zixibacteria bacterium]